jgi:hypothetical protein
MARNEDIEQLRQFVMEHDLPTTDVAMFGVMCPYCGKSDRIRALDRPEKLETDLPGNEHGTYRRLWESLVSGETGLGVCKFCQNILSLLDGNRAESLLK